MALPLPTPGMIVGAAPLRGAAYVLNPDNTPLRTILQGGQFAARQRQLIEQRRQQLALKDAQSVADAVKFNQDAGHLYQTDFNERVQPETYTAVMDLAGQRQRGQIGEMDFQLGLGRQKQELEGKRIQYKQVSDQYDRHAREILGDKYLNGTTALAAYAAAYRDDDGKLIDPAKIDQTAARVGVLNGRGAVNGDVVLDDALKDLHQKQTERLTTAGARGGVSHTAIGQSDFFELVPDGKGGFTTATETGPDGKQRVKLRYGKEQRDILLDNQYVKAYVADKLAQHNEERAARPWDKLPEKTEDDVLVDLMTGRGNFSVQRIDKNNPAPRAAGGVGRSSGPVLSADGAPVAGVSQLVTVPGQSGDKARSFTFAEMPTRSLSSGKGPAKQLVAEKVELGRVYLPGANGAYSPQYLNGLHNAALGAPQIHFKDDRGNVFDLPASIAELPEGERMAAAAKEADRRGAGNLRAVWMQPFAAAKPTQYSLVNGLDEAVAEATAVRREYEAAAKQGKGSLIYNLQLKRAEKETDPEKRRRILANAESFRPPPGKGVPVMSEAEIAAKVRKATDASETVGYKEVDPQWESQTRAYTRGAYQMNAASRRLASDLTGQLRQRRAPRASTLPSYGVAASPAATSPATSAPSKTTGGHRKTRYSKQ